MTTNTWEDFWKVRRSVAFQELPGGCLGGRGRLREGVCVCVCVSMCDGYRGRRGRGRVCEGKREREGHLWSPGLINYQVLEKVIKIYGVNLDK